MKMKLLKILFAVHLFVGGGVLSSNFVIGNTLPASIIALPENENAILVEKQAQMLYVYSLKENELQLVFSAPCSTGEVFGPKKKAGDKKTPEGVYFLVDEYEDRDLTPIYGEKAFPSDYPNFYDQRLGKDGSAIWIHGTDKILKPMDSNGCIALENKNILSLSDYIRLDSTPMIIVEKIIKTAPAVQADREKKVHKLLSEWSHSIEAGSYHQYLAFYSDEYVPDISWWENWLKLRDKSNGDQVSFKIQTVNAGIYAYKDLVVVLFDLVLSSGKEKILIGKRKLFMSELSNGYKIVGDTLQTKSKDNQSMVSPLIAAAQKLVDSTKDNQSMVSPLIAAVQKGDNKPKEASAMETIQKWMKAWSSKDLDTYAGFYAANFSSDGLGKKAWVKRKTQISKKNSYIRVTGTDFQITQKKDSCEIRFFQNYESSTLSTKGTKHLKLVRKGGLWKIFQENWKEK